MKTLAVLIMVLSLLGFAATPSISAPLNTFTNIFSLTGLTYSPASDSPPLGTTATPADDIYINQWGSVWIAMDSATTEPYSPPAGTTQPTGVYGLAYPLTSNFGTGVSRYQVKFDAHFRAYDSQDFFGVYITKDSYVWDPTYNAVTGVFIWNGSGGGSYDLTPATLMVDSSVAPGGNYFLNIFMYSSATNNSTYNTSWGRFSDVTVKAVAVPEPGILILLGISMASIAGLTRWWKA